MYSRYLVPARSFFKTWHHYDSYPLFSLWIGGTAGVLYFSYRKVWKHPDIVTNGPGILDPETDGSMGEREIDKILDWTRWFKMAVYEVGVMNEALGFAGNMTISGEKGKRNELSQCSWDQTEMRVQPKNDIDDQRSVIQPSALQTMIAMKDIPDDELPGIVDSIVAEYTTAADTDLTKEGRVKLANELALHADVLEKQYAVIAHQSGLKSDTRVKDYCNKLAGFANTADVSAQDWADLLVPSKRIEELESKIHKHGE